MSEVTAFNITLTIFMAGFAVACILAWLFEE